MLDYLSPASATFVDTMDKISRRLERAQREISTGLKISTISDEPDSISALLQARADLAATNQIQANLSRVKAETDGAEQALQSSVTMIERANTLAAQGATDTATADARKSLADQVGSLMEQLVGLSTTTIEGRYVFSGNADQTAPYSIDWTQTPPVSAYQGSAANRLVQHPNGSSFNVSRTAQEIFDAQDDPTHNVFASLESLRTALLNNDTAAIRQAQGNVSSSLTYLNGQLAYYGNVQNKVADATTFGQNLTLRLQTHLSSIQDADLTQSIMDLTQAQLQQTATLQAQAKVPKQTLFDFLG